MCSLPLPARLLFLIITLGFLLIAIRVVSISPGAFLLHVPRVPVHMLVAAWPLLAGSGEAGAIRRVPDVHGHRRHKFQVPIAESPVGLGRGVLNVPQRLGRGEDSRLNTFARQGELEMDGAPLNYSRGRLQLQTAAVAPAR